MGFRNGSRVRPGTEFEIKSMAELAGWMKVLKDQPKPAPKPKEKPPVYKKAGSK